VDGSLPDTSGWAGAPALSEIIEFWRNKYGLGDVEEFEVLPMTTVYRYSGSADDPLVWYYEVEGLEHRWPTEDKAGFDASDVVWEFFSQFIG
jgi:poly(3-hydroxybutyrate) depolymerase